MNRFRVLPMVDDMADNKGSSQQTEQAEQEEGDEREEFVHGERGVGLFSEEGHVAQAHAGGWMGIEVEEALEGGAGVGHGGTGGELGEAYRTGEAREAHCRDCGTVGTQRHEALNERATVSVKLVRALRGGVETDERVNGLAAGRVNRGDVVADSGEDAEPYRFR